MMDMKARKKVLCFIVIATLIASLQIKSGLGDTGTFYPTATNDDGFITAIGNHFRDTPYLRLRSPTTDIINGLRFRSLDIPQDAKINNATLSVRTFHTYDPGVVLVTIYGVDENDAYAFNNSGDFTRAYTSNNVIWNVSEVNGNSWHTVSVTNIVQEIISRYGWRPGNSLAFIILADSGEPRREFATIDYNIIYRPRLEIYWDETPPTPSENAPPPYNDTDVYEWEYVNTSQGIDIWTATIYGLGNLNWVDFTDWHSHTDNLNVMTVINSTYLDLYSKNLIHDGLAQYYSGLHNHSVENWGNRTFSWKLHYLDDGSANNDPFLAFWSMGKQVIDPGPVGSYEDANEAIIAFCIFDYDPQTDNYFRIGFVVFESSNLWYPGLYSMPIPAPTQEFYTHIEWNMSAGTPYVQAWVFNNSQMISPYLVYTYRAEAAAYWPSPTTSYTYENLFQNIYIKAADVSYGNATQISYLPDDAPTSGDQQWFFIVYPNGTLVDDEPCDTLECAKDKIDDLLGVDPEDPQTDEYGEALTKNRWKTFVFVIGMIMFLGTPTFAMLARVGTGRWIMVLFVSLCGLSILWSLIYM